MSFSKLNIQEANRHLQALHMRVQELESMVKEQAEALIRKDEQMQVKIAELVSAKEAEVTQFQQALYISEQKVQNLMTLSRNKDARIFQLKQRCEHLDELLKTKPVLENILEILKQAEHQHTNGTPPQLQQEQTMASRGGVPSPGGGISKSNSKPTINDVINSPQSGDPRNFSIGEDSDAAGSGDEVKKKSKELYL
ncbi:uncharacterized protein LOC106180130 [Lingula anatina]|uniref:Uncharacterized protein LOC106180130 n=1 Tax=Lingula anatina TaxID=7574 RepID=A0A1S3KAG0_LINAN|nr:uncharacterized protein LOC106180130 [Lingula anatina]|eukprot:XP_013419482.2 uncharacterized protein LOC106180130 [Lingula anatina]